MANNSRPKYLLAMDSETSGLAAKSRIASRYLDSGKFFQAVSWGLCVVDFDTLEIVDHLYVEVKPVPGVEWSQHAEKIHGLSREHLEANGLSEEDAVVEICELILKYWGADTPIISLGHNIAFDLAFLQDMLERHGINVRFSNRVIDTNTLNMVLLDNSNSNQLFESCGFSDRGAHNALEDILMTVESMRLIRQAWINAGGKDILANLVS